MQNGKNAVGIYTLKNDEILKVFYNKELFKAFPHDMRSRKFSKMKRQNRKSETAKYFRFSQHKRVHLELF